MLAAVDMAVLQYSESSMPSTELKQQMEPGITSSQSYPFTHTHTMTTNILSPSLALEEKSNIQIISPQPWGPAVIPADSTVNLLLPCQ